VSHYDRLPKPVIGDAWMRCIDRIIDETWIVLNRIEDDPDYWEVMRFKATGECEPAIVHIRDFFECKIFRKVT